MTVTVDVADRVDKVLARAFPAAGRRQLARMFADGAVRLGGRKLAKGDRVAAGDVLDLAHAPATEAEHAPVADPAIAARLTVLAQTAAVVVVDKPAGIPSQPLRAGETGTVANGLAAGWPECAAACVAADQDPRDGGLVHRLDVWTSGAIAAARTPAAYHALRAAFRAGTVRKEYLAIVRGRVAARSCEASLAQRGDHVVVDEAGGLSAHTEFEVVRAQGDGALMRCIAHTGRMHQVRAHLALVGAPIVGDVRYGGPPAAGDDGFYLHAARLALPAVEGGEPIVADAPIPERFAHMLRALVLDG
jgi:23S rRNA pseudouridine1911/1915/1917 synthase